MAKTLRTEEWTFDVEGMISTAIVNVFEGEVVHVSEDILRVEMGQDPKDYFETVVNEKFLRVVPYSEFKDWLLAVGGTYAGTT